VNFATNPVPVTGAWGLSNHQAVIGIKSEGLSRIFHAKDYGSWLLS